MRFMAIAIDQLHEEERKLMSGIEPYNIATDSLTNRITDGTNVDIIHSSAS